MAEAVQIQLKKGVLDLCVLALLSRGDAYAYDIASRLGHGGAVYPLMRRMQADRLVETYLAESPTGPPRKYLPPDPRCAAHFSAQRAGGTRRRR